MSLRVILSGLESAAPRTGGRTGFYWGRWRRNDGKEYPRAIKLQEHNHKGKGAGRAAHLHGLLLVAAGTHVDHRKLAALPMLLDAHLMLIGLGTGS